jgi:hypothetical protein
MIHYIFLQISQNFNYRNCTLNPQKFRFEKLLPLFIAPQSKKIKNQSKLMLSEKLFQFNFIYFLQGEEQEEEKENF